MKSRWSGLLSGLLSALMVAFNAQAQLLEAAPAAPLEALPVEPFKDNFEPYPRTYGSNTSANPNDRLFNREFKTDPRLLMGVAITPTLAFETGYVHLLDRGFHWVLPREAPEAAGALGTRGSSMHVAAKVTLPLSDSLSAYGKLGLAHSVRPVDKAELAHRQLPKNALQRFDTGVYAGAGASLKVNERTTIGAKVEKHGNAAKSFGSGTNSTGLKADLKMGF